MGTNKDKDTFDENLMYSKNTIKERFEYLFNMEHFVDVHFVVGSDSVVTKYPAHKLVLSVGSTVFAAMFYGKLAESSDHIKVPDIEPDAFFELLRFLYLDIEKVQINEENVVSVLNAAVKYAVPKLRNHCISFLIDSLSAENVFQTLEYANFFSSVKLETTCWNFIDWNINKVLDSEEFVGLNLETLCSVVERGTLRIREILLFQAVLKWATAECERKQLECVAKNQRFVADEAIKLIRFSAIRMEEYIRHVSSSGVITNEEELSILRHYTFPSRPNTMFIDKPRTSCKVYRLNRFDSTTTYSLQNVFGELVGRIRFTVDTEILFVGFAIYNWHDNTKEHRVRITMNETKTNITIAKNDPIVIKDNSADTFEATLNTPIRILPNVEYMGEFSIAAAIYNCGYNNRGIYTRAIQTEIGNINFHFPNSDADSNLISQLIFFI